ncbi:hypothetical protein P3T76_009938 [Phytophthora citrophthora]|uniref:Uncharacterized protein n=1 Tax=Phytophthora citrophthora TaxID=4793 RepID=A0AAD9LHZ7_9STRA|nr:hypothetical protein P3T76_009938 [Phytophthora citrophthora]
MTKGPKAKRQQLHRVLVGLVALGFLTLVAQISIASLFGHSGDQLKLRRAISQRIPWRHRTGRNESQELMQPTPVPVPDEISDEDLLHLSLLHERCVADTDAVLPWQFGSPGHQLPNASADNPDVLLHQNDSNVLQKLKQCPDVDIYLPNHLHGNGYCEDAVAYAKCEYLSITMG